MGVAKIVRDDSKFDLTWRIIVVREIGEITRSATRLPPSDRDDPVQAGEGVYNKLSFIFFQI